VLDVLRSGRLSLGPVVERFERALAERVGAPHVASVSSGTAGLHLCVRLAGIGPGDEVITSPFSFVASANCVIYEGATPVFVDVDPRTLNLDPAAVEAAVTERTRAILPVHIFGYPAELDALAEIARRHGLVVIEDACEAIGARYRGRPVGSSGNPAVFAFYPNKQVTTGEGGAVAVHDERDWRLLKSLANQGRADDGGWLDHARLGFNYRLSDVAAAIGLAQVERLDELLAARAEAAARYTELIGDLEGLTLPLADDAVHRRSWFVYVVTLPERVDRERVIERLAAAGIQTARYLPAIHLQSYMRERYGFREGMLPVCEDVSARTLALPFFAEITLDQQAAVARELRAAL
jgi:perosamine synthetase